MDLVAALERVCELLASSEDSNWTASSVAEIREDLQQILSVVRSGGDFDKSRLQLLFLPTGPVQEVSLANGWSAEMLELAEAVDQYLDARTRQTDC